MKSPIAIVASLTLMLVAPCAGAASASAASRIAPDQEIVALLSSHDIRARPNAHERPIGLVTATRPITGERTVLPVLAQTIDSHRRAWLRVRLPGRALGGTTPPRTGWINASHTLISTTAWHIVVDLNAHRVFIYRDSRRLHSYPAIVGKPSTPTPTGEYFVEENVHMLANQPGGPFALATSDRSNVFQEFEGGPGQIAIHGLDNLGGQLGTAISHGCVRLADAAISWLAERISPGVPVTITG
ncbi:MAG: L,D-transpeptidase [Solirubrobacteraceae bacterium]